MENKVRKIVIGGIIGFIAFVVITSSCLYDNVRRTTKKISKDFDNWGEEFLYDY